MEDRYEERLLRAKHWGQAFVPDLAVEKPNVDERKTSAHLIRELFDLRERIAVRNRPPDSVEAYLHDRMKDAGRVLEHLQAESDARVQLHDQSVREIDYQISRAAFGLERFAYWGVGYNRGIDMRRAHLEEELSQLRRERRGILARSWNEVIGLRKMFRDALAEYRALQRRLAVLGD
jgi:hypothetical protein